MNAQSRLTNTLSSIMLLPLSQKTKVGICNPRKGVKTPIKTLSVFLCPQYSNNTGLIRVLSSMVDCFRGVYAPPVPLRVLQTCFNPPPYDLQQRAAVIHFFKGIRKMNTSKTIKHAKAIADSDGIIRVQDPNLKPPKGYYQLCIACRFDKFSNAYAYCPNCGNSALSHGVYVKKGGK